MELKVNLPNPDEMSIEQWFSQMRISLKAAEKAYQEVFKNLTEEERKLQIENDCDKKFWIRFQLPSLDENLEDDLDPNGDKRQKIQIVVNSL